ncbi:MAG TPA: putative lipid II flippase FtsW [Deltaproteobacteria bacterium]|nr:putative lipid II flippase FtsW [Deltaproteobacteria bacterium]
MAIGMLMVYSASAIYAQDLYRDSYFFLKKEVVFLAAALLLMFTFKSINYHIYYKLTYPLLFATLALLLVTFVPGIGHRAGGAQRWIGVGGFTLQPSELAKLAVIVFMAYTLAKKKEKIKDFKVGFLPAICIVGLTAGLVLLQKDLGTTFVITFVAFLLLFIGGTRLAYLAGGLLAALPALYFLIFAVEFRRKRILAFLNPWEHQLDEGFQIIQSYVAFNAGGLTGAGLGQGKQKLFYLPAAHTDFIFSVLGEELGLIGVFSVILLFIIFMWRGIKIATRAPDLFGTYLAIGITALITAQALLNFGVVMGLLPTKGLPLPFISYGGTSLLVLSIMVGILLNIASQSQKDYQEEST